MTKADIARSYRKKYGMEIPHLTLAKVMHADDPMKFGTVENARETLRQIAGKSGGKMHKSPKVDEFRETAPRTPTPYHLVEPASKDLEPFRLPSSFNRFILAADFHMPNHRLEPIIAMLDYAKANSITKLFINGDLLDNTPFSKWAHEPVNPKDVPRWFDEAMEMLRTFKKYFSEIYFLEGNHDFWYKRFLMSQAPMLFHDTHYHLETRLHLAEIGIKFIDQKYLVKAGHLNIVHGHILFKGGGNYANGARMLYLKTKTNTIASHLHVPSEHTDPDLNDKIVTTYVTGCMCTLRPEYLPYGGKAAHGFADITIYPNKDFHVDNFRIQNGKIF